MGTKQYRSATDLLTFSRASGGTALRRVGYGTELLTNSEFDDGLTGWTDSSSAPSFWSVSGGVATQNTDGAAVARLRQSFTTVVGKVYKVSFVGTLDGYAIGTTSGNSDILPFAARTDGYFVAVGTTTWFNTANNTDGLTFESVTVKEVTFDVATDPLVLFNHPDDVPRIEYDAAGAVKGLLIEEARTNLVPYSEGISQWSAVGTATITNQTQVAPDGTSRATLVDIGATGNALGPNRVEYPATGLTAGSKATVSLYLKKPDTDAASHINVRAFCSGTTTTDAIVDYSTSDFTLVNANAAVDTVHTSQDVGNGWYRVSFTFTLDASGTGACNLRVGGLISELYTATGTDVIFWGAQLEEGDFPSSYIPTTGVTATRAADVALIPTSAFGFNSGAGTVVVEAQRFGTNNYPRSVMIDAGSESNSIGLGAWGTNTDLNGYIVSGGVVQAAIGTGSAGTSAFKNSLAYKENDFAASRDGNTVVTDTSGVVPTGLTTLRIGRNENTTQYLNGHIKSIQYYPRRLTNAQLQELTT